MKLNQIPLPEGLEIYSYTKKNEAVEKYYFTTAFGVEYIVRFKPSGYVFGEHKPYNSLLYEFSLIAQFAGAQSYVRDDKIAATVVAIFLDFYNQKEDSISFYICDSSDSKQHVRKRKFDSWFNEYNKGAFIKLDGEIKDIEGIQYPVALIMRKTNPYKDHLAVDFVNLLAGINEGK